MTRKVFVLMIAILSAIAIFFTLAYLKVPLGEPSLRVEFYPPPPWQVRPGDSLEVSIGVANDAWLLAWAKDIRVNVFMPEGFTITQTGTNQCELPFFTLCGGDGLGNGFTARVSNTVSPGNYTITIKIAGDNVPEKIFTPRVSVAA